MEGKREEAEARLLAKRLGASAIGPSWAQALHTEFKKNYMDKVRRLLLLLARFMGPVSEIFGI